MTFQLRPHQIAAADAVEDAYARNVTRPVVDMCVGAGKSYTMAELTRRAWLRGERSIILADRRELVEQNAAAVEKLGVECGINAAALNQRCWRAPVISASIHSVFRNTSALGRIDNILTDEAHMIQHGQAGMYRQLLRAFPSARQPGFSGTIFRLQGGSLVEGEDAPFEECVYNYTIIDGINDGYLVPAFSAEGVEDKMNPDLLKKTAGEFSAASQDAQMLDLIENHIVQMKIIGANRRAWLIFEASVKSANAMAERLRAHGIPAGVVTEKTGDDERKRLIEDFKAGRLRSLVNVGALTTGFDAQITDMLVMRRRTASLGLHIQMVGRLLRTIGGNIEASRTAGKEDGIVVDFAGNIDQHGPLDFIRPKETTVKMVSCEGCKSRNTKSARNCWSCDAVMQKVCPGCLEEIDKGLLKCPLCEHDMRTLAEGTEAEPRKINLFETPSGAALISSFAPSKPKEGGWLPIKKAYQANDRMIVLDCNGDSWPLPEAMWTHAAKARWVRGAAGEVQHLLKPNGLSRSTAMQVSPTGATLPIPMPTSLT